VILIRRGCADEVTHGSGDHVSPRPGPPLPRPPALETTRTRPSSGSSISSHRLATTQIYLAQLSLNLKGIISQRLVPGIDGKRVAGRSEILLDTPPGQGPDQEGAKPTHA